MQRKELVNELPVNFRKFMQKQKKGGELSKEAKETLTNIVDDIFKERMKKHHL